MNDQVTHSDSIQALQAQIGSLLTVTTPSTNPGWLTPQAAYQLYTQYGVIGHVVKRIATLMTKSDWTYLNSDVAKFNWSTVQSRLETLKLRTRMKSASIFWLRDGGGAVEAIVDDGPNVDRGDPLIRANVRRVKSLKAWSAANLKPMPGFDWSNTPKFQVITSGNYNRRSSDPEFIHRTRLSIVVGNDVPPGGGRSSTTYVNTITGWPPSWLEGLYRSHEDWRRVENDISQRVHTGSLIHIALEGYREAMNGPSEDEKAEVLAVLQDIVDTLQNDGVLFTDIQDKLIEVGRAMTGLDPIVKSKKETFLADVGLPQELVLMVAAGNLGDNSGPINAAYDMIDGMRIDVLTPVIEEQTDLVLIEQRRKAGREGEALEIPTEYTTEWGEIAEQTAEQRAKAGRDDAARRKADTESGTPFEVLATDPTFQAAYPGLAAWLEEQNEARIKAAAIEANSPQPPEDDLVAAGVIAKKIGVGAGKIRSMIASGEIPGRKIGARWKASWKAVWAALEEAQSNGEFLAEDRLDAARAWAGSRTDLDLTESTEFGTCFGASDAMREIFTVLERVAPTPISVLITGETGTGKEGIARGLHTGEGRFMVINCAALPDDPARARAQLAQAAAQAGTLFLDEVADLSPDNQVAALRVLSDAKARIVSATSQDLSDPLAFRLDLYMRLAGVEVEVPPLRDREDDVIALATMFAESASEDAGRAPPEPLFTHDALAAMRIYPWPGNVRELKNAIERALVMADPGQPLAAEHMQLRIR